MRERLYQLYGERRRPGRGAARRPAAFRSPATSRRWPSRGRRRGPQHVFVNRRIVRDRTIAHAIGDAYSVASIKERSPEVHLFIEMPPTPST
jgi:DNA mismatch repair protein MutL